jgi:hypothetical protein
MSALSRAIICKGVAGVDIYALVGQGDHGADRFMPCRQGIWKWIRYSSHVLYEVWRTTMRK